MTKKQLIGLGVSGLAIVMSGTTLGTALGLQSDESGFVPHQGPSVALGNCVTATIGTRTIYSIGGKQVSKEECEAANATGRSPYPGLEGSR